jgi:hypothetical protein
MWLLFFCIILFCKEVFAIRLLSAAALRSICRSIKAFCFQPHSGDLFVDNGAYERTQAPEERNMHVPIIRSGIPCNFKIGRPDGQWL